MVTWVQDGFAFAESYDESTGRYRALQIGRQAPIADADTPGLLVKPDVAKKQLDAEDQTAKAGHTAGAPAAMSAGADGSKLQPGAGAAEPKAQPKPKRFHGTVPLDATRVGRDASRVADEVITHLAGLVGAQVRVTLEIEAEIPGGAPDNVVRTVTENSRTLKFTSHGFEQE